MLNFRNPYDRITSSPSETEKAQASEENNRDIIHRIQNLTRVLKVLSFKVEGNITPWILSTVFFAALSALVTFNDDRNERGLCGYRFGVMEKSEMARTDRILGIPQTTIVSVPFTGSPSFDTHGYAQLAPGSPPYTGDPRPEIDEAWEALKGGRYFSITEEEAKDLWGEGYMEFEDKTFGGFTAGLDIFHGLHCINQIRLALHPDSYPPPSALHGPLHLAHCITHLRQLVQCSGDTTPNPTKYYQGIHQNYVHVDRVHTCRDWEAIREWGWERFNGSLNVGRELEG